MRNTLMKPIAKAYLTAEEYLKLVETDANNIKKSKFIPPTIGRKGFGFFEVEYKHPVLTLAKSL